MLREVTKGFHHKGTKGQSNKGRVSFFVSLSLCPFAMRLFCACCLVAAAFAQTPPQTQTPPPTQDPRGIGLKPDPKKPDPKKPGQTTSERPELILQTGHAEKIDAIAFTPDGRYLASGSSDRTIKLWDAVAARELRTLSGNAGGVRALAFSPDGATLASAGLFPRRAPGAYDQAVRP